MLNATQSKSIVGAVKYFEAVLSQGDYYLGTEIAAYWHGKAARILGLDPSKQITKKQFEALLQGKHPVTAKKLAQRMRADRRPAVDFTFSVPKSVSIAWAINQDERIIEIFKRAVQETMDKDVQALVHRRVRDGANFNTTNRKQTGNFVYSDFLHKTSRPVGDVVDMQLHVHAVAKNLTFDEGVCYAAEYAEVMRQLPSLQAKFDARLARLLEGELGYAIEQTSYKQSNKMKVGWELKGINRATIEKFSQRTQQIEDVAAAEGIVDPAAKGKLAKKTRQKKDSHMSIDQLREHWRSRLTGKERKAFDALRAGAIGSKQELDYSQRIEAAINFSLEHHLFRQSTVERHQIVGTALERGLTLAPEDVEKALDKSKVIARSRTIDGAERHFITTPEVLAAEESMIKFAQDGRGTRYRLGQRKHQFQREWLNEQQKNAIHHVLGSRDTVIGVTGGAGTGKTALMQEAVEAIQVNKRRVWTFAPSTGAREVLQGEGFDEAQTVEHLLRNTTFHNKLKEGDVLWIDEAGLLDVRSMNGVFKIAKKKKLRVVLSGDTRQHSSPRRGEALRLLESKAGLNVVRIEEIQRQKGLYKKAVSLISKGNEIVDPVRQTTGLVAGFDILDKLGKIKEISDEDRYQVLAEHYIKNTQKRKSALIVAPTNAEARVVTEEIRERLREAGAIGVEERDFTQLKSLYLSDAEKKQASSYSPEGMVIQFHQNAKGGFKRGERYTVQSTKNGVMLTAANGIGQCKPLPYAEAKRFEVYQKQTIRIAKGDKVRFTLGGTAKDGKRRISNGRLDQIQKIDRRGRLLLKSGMTIDASYGHMDFGYVVTSHGAQGKTKNLAIAAMGSQSLPAINAKQFYVTVSRGSEDVAIYVDDTEKVRRAIQEAGQQLSATELVEDSPKNDRTMAIGKQQAQRRQMELRRSLVDTHQVGRVNKREAMSRKAGQKQVVRGITR